MATMRKNTDDKLPAMLNETKGAQGVAAKAKSAELKKKASSARATQLSEQFVAPHDLDPQHLVPCEARFEDGTNLSAGTQFRAELTSKVLPWYAPSGAKASSTWKHRWETLRSRFERIIDEFSPLECVLVQTRIPACGISGELPAILHGRHSVLVRNGLALEPCGLFALDGGPLNGLFPIKSVKGNPMLNQQGGALALRFGMSRRFFVHPGLGWAEPTPLPIPRLWELARDGTHLLYQLPVDVAVSLWRNWPSGFSKARN